MSCSSGCRTKNHSSYGECLRAKRVQIEGADARKYMGSVWKQHDAYAEARYAGLQPETWYAKDVETAWRETERTGKPFRADSDDPFRLAEEPT